MSIRAAASWLAAACFLAIPASAQQLPSQQRGLTAATAYQPDQLDTVNLFNGQLALTLPIGSGYPIGPDLGFQLTLAYNSNVWDYSEEFCTLGGEVRRYFLPIPDPSANAGLGWSLHLGKLYEPHHEPFNDGPRWLYVDSAGGHHSFYTELHPGYPAAGTQPQTWFTNDSTYLRMQRTSQCRDVDGTAPQCHWIEHPGGQVHELHFFNTPQFSGWHLTRIRDRHGNHLDVDYPNGTTWELSDAHGRVQRIHFAAPAYDYTQVTEVELTRFGGGTASWVFEYREEVIERQGYTPLACAPPGHEQTVSVQVLDRVVFPDDSFYEMDYVTTDDTPSDILSGGIRQLRLLTGGAYRWTYTGIDFTTQDPDQLGPDPVRTAWGVASKGIFEDDGDVEPIGTWAYDYKTGGADLPVAPGDPGNVPCHHVTTVTNPEGHESVHYFSTSRALHLWSYGLTFTRCNPTYSASGPFLSQEVYDEKGLKLRSVFTEYESDGRDGGQHQEKNHRLSYRRTVFHDDGDRYAEVTFSDFDGLGHYRQLELGGNFGAGDVKSTFVDFNPERGTLVVIDPDQSILGGDFQVPARNDPWVLETFRERRTTEAGEVAVQEFCFDAATGFLERQRTLAGSTRANGDLLAVFEPAPTGHVARERLYGGDTQGPMDNVYPDLCQMSVAGLDTQYQVDSTYTHGSLQTARWIDPCDGEEVLRTADHAIDPSTGLVSVSFDASGVSTAFGYDDLSRLVLEMPEESAWTETEYRLPTTSQPNLEAQLTVSQCPNVVTGCSGAELLSWGRSDYDGLGRLVGERTRIPTAGGGLSLQERVTSYNALGWKLEESVWGDTTKLTKWSGYDPFGRPGTIEPPGQPETHLVYQGVRVLSRESRIATGAGGAHSSVYTTEIRDRQGRLSSVCEAQASPWAGSCASTETRYEHDVADRLVSVCSNAAGSSCGQERLFDFDQRGFLEAERHPEIAPSGNGWTRYPLRDALGNPLSRTIDGSPEHALLYKYDPASRLIRLSEANGPSGPRLLIENYYARTNRGDDRRKGKLYQSKRHNWVDPVAPFGATGSLDVVVTQTYQYEGQDGRISRRVTSLKLPEVTTYAFDVEVAWSELGLLESLDYPRCLHGTCLGRDPARTVGYGYDRGFLTSVAGFAPAITYQAGGFLHQVQHANGVTWTQEIDPSNGLSRPHRISTTAGWDSGIYGYDGATNIQAIGQQSFRYDRYQRLISGEVPVGVQERTQTASFDVYGNLLSLTTNGSTLVTGASAATNRLTSLGALYDGAGNLTRQVRGGVTYGYVWDPLNALKYLQTNDDQARVFLYDADGERFFTFDCFPNVCAGQGFTLTSTIRGLGGQVLREYVQTIDGWEWTRDDVYRGGQVLASVVPREQGGEEVFHFHPDHLGSPRQVTDGAGVEVARHAYYPFGEEATDPTQDAFPKKFTGHERDDNGLGAGGDLDYMHARYCSPTLGRFLSFDPIGGNPRTPQSWNRYAYVLNRPLGLVDLFGMMPVATFHDEILVLDTASTNGISIPSWIFNNWWLDASPHFNASRFDFSQRSYPAWEGWGGLGGCDEWCQVFAEVGEAGDAASFLEFGVTSAFLSGVLGPVFSRVPSLGLKTAPRIHMGKQGKHIPGHNNYIEGRSILRVDPERLAARAGTGKPVSRIPRGQAGFKERVDFGEVIGDFVEEGVATPTTKGIITYAADGTIHIIPVRP